MMHPAEQLLRAFFEPDDLIEFRPIECWTQDGKKRSRLIGRRWQRIADMNGTLQWLEEINRAPHFGNAFFGVNPRCTEGGSKEHVKLMRVVWADLDCCATDEAKQRCLNARLPEPNIIVSSSPMGTHLYWLLAEPYRIESETDGDRVEAVVAEVCKLIGGDSTQDRSRVLRLPGFPNVKDARNGTPPVPCELDKLDTEPALESIDELITLLPEAAQHRIDWAGAKIPEDNSDESRRQVSESTTDRTKHEIPEAILKSIKARLTQPAKNNDRSTYNDFPLLKDLIRKGYSKAAIWEAVRPYSKFAERHGQRYFDRSHEKAKAEIAADDEPIFNPFGASSDAPSPSTVCVATPRLTGHARLMTDVGNAARFALQHGDNLRFCYATGRWFGWNGKLWRPDDTGRVMKLAKATALSILEEAKQAETDQAREALSKHAVRSQKRDRLSAMLELAKPELAVRASQFDNDPWALNTLSGILDLRTGGLRPHDPTNWMTKIAPVKYDCDAECPLWLRFLDRIFDHDQDLIEFVRRFLGYALSGDIGLQILAIFHGEGGNGKNVLLDTVCGIMGDYATKAPPNLLVASRHEHPTEIADLMGRRLVVASETEEGARLKLQLVKELTGDARLKGRFMRQDYFEFERTFKTVLVTNNKPQVRENTEAAWRRIRLVPFNVIIPPKEQDTRLTQKLRQEWPGIAVWLVSGCVAYVRHGLPETPSVINATQTYRRESDTFAQFIDECCVFMPSAWVATGALREAYERWCGERGDKRPLGGNAFTERLRKAGGKPERLNHRRGWGGIGLAVECESGHEEMA